MNVRELIKEASGLNLTVQAAERALSQRMAELGLDNAATYLRTITPGEVQALIELVVVPESWMFRDPQAFASATDIVRAMLAREPQRRLRILSIPCASGEEPYSLAMALADAMVPAAPVSIEAIDLSEVSLERARRGRYTKNAFRSADLAFRERYFDAAGSEYQIHDSIRARVSFRQANLLSLDAILHAGVYDVIFCRNLLIYFDDATTATAVAKLRLMLADDGVLFAGYAEVPVFCNRGFTPMRMPGAFALQKERRAAPRLAQPAAVATLPRMAPLPRPARPAAAVPAVSTSSAKPDPHRDLARARALADQGDLAAAATLCHALLAASPESAEAYYILGMVSESGGQPDQASHYWRRCVYLQPDHYEALCHLALLADGKGDRALAAAFRQRAARVYGKTGGRAQ